MHRFLVKLCFVALHMSSNSMGAPPNINEAIDIFDSTELPNINEELEIFNSDNLLKFDMPASCIKDNFCFDKGNEYPEREIEKLLHTLLLTKDRIGTDLIFSEGFEDPDCPTNTTFADKPIYYIRDEKNKVRAVIQSKNFTQIYSAKWCQRPGRISYNTTHLLEGSHMLNTFRIECVNMYMNFDFLVLTDEGEAETVKAKNGIPVCCSCRYSKPGGD